MNIDGGCHCGLIRCEARIEPDAVAVCHCTDCQMLSGTAFRVVVPAPAVGFRLTAGQPQTYVKTAESGKRRVQAFRPECGTPIYATSPTDRTSYSLRVGTIRQRAELAPRVQNWMRSAQPWVSGIGVIRQNFLQA